MVRARFRQLDGAGVDNGTVALTPGSDLHIYRGHQPGPYGYVIGHEAVGTVAAVGPGVKSFKVGDKVIAPFATACGECGVGILEGGLRMRERRVPLSLTTPIPPRSSADAQAHASTASRATRRAVTAAVRSSAARPTQGLRPSTCASPRPRRRSRTRRPTLRRSFCFSWPTSCQPDTWSRTMPATCSTTGRSSLPRTSSRVRLCSPRASVELRSSWAAGR